MFVNQFLDHEQYPSVSPCQHVVYLSVILITDIV